MLAALLERDRTGEGCVADVSLYETALGYVGYHLVGYLADGTIPVGEGTRFPMVAPYQVFPTRDGELMIAGGNDRLFAAICDVLEAPELVDDARFRTNPDRVRNRDELYDLLVERLAHADSADWLRRLTEAGVPAAPVADIRDVAEVAADRGARDAAAARRTRASTVYGCRRLPLSFDGERAVHRSAPPDVGAHSGRVLP